MLNVYSTNVTATTAMTVPFNNVAVQRGYSAVNTTDGIKLNAPGIYEVTLSAYGSTTAIGTFGFTFQGNGTDIAQSTVSEVTAAGEDVAIATTALVQVNGALTGNALLTVEYTGDAGTIQTVNLVVKKVG